MTDLKIVTVMTEVEAIAITEQIQESLDGVIRDLALMARAITRAYDRRADEALGFDSWNAYAEANFGPRVSVLSAGFRRELTALLSASGMTSRGIAPVVGITDRGVRKAIASQVGTRFPPAPDPVGVDGGEAVTPTAPSPVTVAAPAPAPPAVEVAGPTASATTPPAKRATVTGLDGKTYTRPALVPPPARDYAQENAEAHCRELANALDVLWALTIPEAFERSFADWAVGAIGARPSARERRTPTTLRAIADALNDYADQLEGLAS